MSQSQSQRLLHSGLWLLNSSPPVLYIAPGRSGIWFQAGLTLDLGRHDASELKIL